jgi:hypothetical protein
MRALLKTGSFVGLGLTVLPAFLVFSGTLTWNTHVVLMAVGSALWFLTAPFWLAAEGSAHHPNEQ